MKGLAYLLRETGEAIVGYDDNQKASQVSLADALTAMRTFDRVVYTDAAVESHPLRVQARKMNIPQLPYQEAVGEFAKKYTVLAVTGTHGKSSTTSFLAHILIENGLDPSVLVGANVPTLPGGHARLGTSKYLVVEADEYRRHFLHLFPQHIIITSIDYDHPDAFSSLQDVEHAYEEFMSHLPDDGSVFVPRAEYEQHQSMQWPKNTVIVEPPSKHIAVGLPGIHMQMNAELAAMLAQSLGVSADAARESLATFPGISRRFELLGTIGDIEIRSDYGHHPTEIAATLTGARESFPTSQLIAIFEAHMPLRLHTFFDQFVSALAHADRVLIVPPFVPAGRDSTATEDVVRLTEILNTKDIPTIFTEDVGAVLAEHTDDVPRQRIAIAFSAGKLDLELRETVKKR
jgi:UDP-N-acetylmuramate--alanine ligase